MPPAVSVFLASPGALRTLTSRGCPDGVAERAMESLRGVDTGYTFSNFATRSTVVITGMASSAGEFYDTLQHELKHITEHISEFYGVDSRSEEAAYLQGEIAKRMFPAVAQAICPVCREHQHIP